MTKALSTFISAVYHPLLMTTLLVMGLLFFAPVSLGLDNLLPQGKWIIIGIFGLLTFVLPMTSIFILRITKNIEDMTMEDRKQRFLPMIFTTVYYGLATYFLVVQYKVGEPLAGLVSGVFGTLLCVTVITFYWKISAHAAGAWGCVGILFSLINYVPETGLKYLLIAFILMAGLVSSARLYLGSHNLRQVIAGGILGFVICFFSLNLIL